MDDTRQAYKVVYTTPKGIHQSVVAKGDLAAWYEMARPTVAQLGYLFLFHYREDAENFADVNRRLDNRPGWYTILYGHAKGLFGDGELVPPSIPYVDDQSGPVLPDIKTFWEFLATAPPRLWNRLQDTLTFPIAIPEGTFLAKAFTPYKVISKRVTDPWGLEETI